MSRHRVPGKQTQTRFPDGKAQTPSTLKLLGPGELETKDEQPYVRTGIEKEEAQMG